MNFPFDITKILNLDSDDFAIFTANDLPKNTMYFGPNNPKKTRPEQLTFLIDEIGHASSHSQGLSTTITTYSRFIYSNHKLFIKFDDNKMIGFIKIGTKNLIYNDWQGKMKELAPLCVLDFYVHESVQRHGFGKLIFEKMLQSENIEPWKVAIDKPSGKFLGFLLKHYGLKNYRSQTNNFVIFDAFFETDALKIEQMKIKFLTKNEQNFKMHKTEVESSKKENKEELNLLVAEFERKNQLEQKKSRKKCDNFEVEVLL